jgi:Tol biopolymer transport system component
MGFDLKKRRGVYSIDVKTGEPTEIVMDQKDHTIFNPQWLPAGNAIIYYRRGETSASRSGVIVRSIENGAEREFPTGPIDYGPRFLSPDGQAIAVTGDSRKTLRVFSLTDGTERELMRVQDPADQLRMRGWTPDSRYVIFETFREVVGRVVKFELSRIPATGGESYRLTTEDFRQGRLQFASDGRVAFSASVGGLEIWAMDRLLSSTLHTGR